MDKKIGNYYAYDSHGCLLNTPPSSGTCDPVPWFDYVFGNLRNMCHPFLLHNKQSKYIRARS
jgi:hypothetical protein